MNELLNKDLVPVHDDHFRLLVGSVRDYVILTLDQDGHITTWNLGAQLITGYAPEEIIGNHFSQFYPADRIALGVPSVQLSNALRIGRLEDEDWRVRKDGTRFWANAVITVLFDADGRHLGFSIVVRDLTERHNNEESLRLSEGRLRLLLAGAADWANRELIRWGALP
jgi:PAS domain S-box-containing protein